MLSFCLKVSTWVQVYISISSHDQIQIQKECLREVALQICREGLVNFHGGSSFIHVRPTLHCRTEPRVRGAIWEWLTAYFIKDKTLSGEKKSTQ